MAWKGNRRVETVAYLEMPDGVGDDGLVARDTGREQRQGGGEGQGGEQLLLGLLLLQLLQEQD